MSEQDLTILSQIVLNYTNPNRQIRQQSEQYLSNLRNKSMGEVCFCLLKLSSLDTISHTIKITSLVLLRKIIEIDSKTKWGDLPNDTKSQIKTTCLTLFINEQNEEVRTKYSDVISELVYILMDYNEKWNELSELANNLSLYDVNDAKNNIPIESLLKIITNSIAFLYEDIMQNYSNFKSFLTKIFTECKYLNLKIQTSALISEILTYGDKKDYGKFTPFFFNILQITLQCFNDNNEKGLTSLLQILNDIVSCEEDMLNEHFQDIFILTGKIAKYTSFTDPKIKELAFELLITIAEATPSFFCDDLQKVKDYLSWIYLHALEDDKDDMSSWCSPNVTSFSNVPTISEERVKFTHDTVERISGFIDIEILLNLLQELIINFLSSENDFWKYVGLITLSQVIYYAEDLQKVDNIISNIFTLLNSKNPKVRYASARCIEKLCESCDGKFQEKYYEEAFNTLLSFLEKENCIRVQCELITTVGSFIIQWEDNSKLNQYMKKCFQLLMTMFQSINYSFLTKKEILILIKDIEREIDESVKPYSMEMTSIFIQYLENIVKNKEQSLIIPDLIQCIVCIGCYSEDILIPKIPFIMKCIIMLIETLKDSVNPMRNPIQESLEQLFPYIKKHYIDIIPHLVETILKLLEYGCLDKDNNDDDIKADVDDVVDCVKLLDIVIIGIKEKYISYYNKTEEICNRLLMNTYKELKANVISIFPSLIYVLYLNKNMSLLKEKAKCYINIIFKQLDKVFDLKLCLNIVESFNKILEYSSKEFTKDEINSLFQEIVKFIKFFENKRIVNIKKKSQRENEIEEEKINNENSDNEIDLEFLNIFQKDIENAEKIQMELIESIENIIKIIEVDPSKIQNYSDILKTIVTTIIPGFLQSENEYPLLLKYPNNIKLAVCLIDDILEYFPYNYISELIQNYLKFLIDCTIDKNPQITQAAVYGLGIFLKKSPIDIYNVYNMQIFDVLKSTSEKYKNIQTRGEGLVFDNAVSAIGKGIIYKNYKNKELFDLWIGYVVLMKFDKNEIKEQINIIITILLGGQFNDLFTLNPIVNILRFIISNCEELKVESKVEQILNMIAQLENSHLLRVAIEVVIKDEKYKEKIDKIILKKNKKN